METKDYDHTISWSPWLEITPNPPLQIPEMEIIVRVAKVSEMQATLIGIIQNYPIVQIRRQGFFYYKKGEKLHEPIDSAAIDNGFFSVVLTGLVGDTDYECYSWMEIEQGKYVYSSIVKFRTAGVAPPVQVPEVTVSYRDIDETKVTLIGKIVRNHGIQIKIQGFRFRRQNVKSWEGIINSQMINNSFASELTKLDSGTIYECQSWAINVKNADGYSPIIKFNTKATPRKCIVTFNSDKGSSVPQQTIVQGLTVNRPPDPIRKNFTFVCWCSDSHALINEYDFNTPVASNITLYAKWKAITIPPSSSIMAEVAKIAVDSNNSAKNYTDFKAKTESNLGCKCYLFEITNTGRQWKKSSDEYKSQSGGIALLEYKGSCFVVPFGIRPWNNANLNEWYFVNGSGGKYKIDIPTLAVQEGNNITLVSTNNKGRITRN